MTSSEDIYLPTLHYFAMNNPFTGSYGLLRFKIVPSITMFNPKEVDMDNSSMTVEIWHGLFCYEKSDIEREKTFPMSEEGRLQMQQWLFDHRAE